MAMPLAMPVGYRSFCRSARGIIEPGRTGRSFIGLGNPSAILQSTSLMCQMIDDLLTEATRAGVVPHTIRLGAVQMRVFEQWAAQCFQTSAAARRSEYDGLPVVPDIRDSYCGVTGTDGEELSLP